MIKRFNSLRKKIEEHRNSLLKKIKRLRRDDPFATQDRSLILEPGSDAAALYGHEQAVVLEEKLKLELKETEEALAKIKRGSYGRCAKCKNKIELARLQVKPQAIYCLKCEKKVESS